MSIQNTLPTGLKPLHDGTEGVVDLGEILDEVPLLQDLPYQDLATLADYMRAYRADPGTVLFAEGKHSDVMYFLVEGSLSVLKESEQGESRRLAFDLLLKVAQLLSFRLRHTSGQLVDYLA